MQDLWNFALELYARPGVEQACLELQDAGVDVCLLLTGAWLQRRGCRCEAHRLDALRTLTAPWQREVVTPLRQLRQHWRADALQDSDWTTLREQVKKLELQAERVLLERLQTLAESWPDGESEDDWLLALAGQDSAALQVLRGAVDSI
ncbi:conserved hypothetical protein [Pseudomonas sp. 8Z]|uniref:TIGR02444 family protein n=1 Tax=Pseudomonas sp. 8Z TaxID=2653166 RepID=UPI0012F0D64B|nr:TIGR02444 family protein [Pseudomonas sp. 8Z]VXC84756.1 conserved hypothetical protein [Pseudomonas sp. 8Z]